MSRRLRIASLTLLATASALAGCGGGDDGAKSDATARTPAPAAANAAEFPKAAGLTFADVQAKYASKLNLAPGISAVRTGGTTRIPFLVLDDQARPVAGAQVALYAMDTDGTKVEGPFPAREQPFGIGPAYLSRTSAANPEQEKQFYVADIKTAHKAPVAMFGLAKVGGKLVGISPQSVGLAPEGPQPPDVGDQAIAMDTLTPEDVDGDYAKLTTRVPPAKDLVETNLADVLGTKPVVLVFATPALCQSRVCGPDVDVAEQVKAETGDKAAWVHQEIYVDNDVKKGLRPQVEKWNLRTEPWLFVVGSDKRIKARVEGAISVPELRALVTRYAK
jgi:hypothetical protein